VIANGIGESDHYGAKKLRARFRRGPAPRSAHPSRKHFSEKTSTWETVTSRSHGRPARWAARTDGQFRGRSAKTRLLWRMKAPLGMFAGKRKRTSKQGSLRPQEISFYEPDPLHLCRFPRTSQRGYNSISSRIRRPWVVLVCWAKPATKSLSAIWFCFTQLLSYSGQTVRLLKRRFSGRGTLSTSCWPDLIGVQFTQNRPRRSFFHIPLRDKGFNGPLIEHLKKKTEHQAAPPRIVRPRSGSGPSTGATTCSVRRPEGEGRAPDRCTPEENQASSAASPSPGTAPQAMIGLVQPGPTQQKTPNNVQKRLLSPIFHHAFRKAALDRGLEANRFAGDWSLGPKRPSRPPQASPITKFSRFSGTPDGTPGRIRA